MSDQTTFKLAVLVSGSGTTLANLIDEIGNARLDCEISIVIGSKPNLKGLKRAEISGLSSVVIDRKTYANVETFSEAVFTQVEKSDVDLVCLAGWLCLLKIPDCWAGKVINIHPSLLPRFGGKGMYGLKVHQAVIDSGSDTSGCTVHYVDNAYDNGPIILQRSCRVLPHDSAVTLAARVFEEEKIAYPEAIRIVQSKAM